MNRALVTSMFALTSAQLLKVPIHYAESGRWDWRNVTEAGGMPSSHSAAVASLATYTALKKGMNSLEFALSAIFGSIVLYDAMGVRRHAGEIATEVNELDVEVEELARRHPGIFHKKRAKELKERVGHLPSEVAGGALYGAAVGFLSWCLDRNR